MPCTSKQGEVKSLVLVLIPRQQPTQRVFLPDVVVVMVSLSRDGSNLRARKQKLVREQHSEQLYHILNS